MVYDCRVYGTFRKIFRVSRNYKRQRHYGFGYWGNEIGLIFLSKNLCRYADFFQRYSRLANPPCRTRFFACSNPIARNLQTQKSHHLWWLFVFVVVQTPPKSGKRYHFLMVSERLYFKVFNHVDMFLLPFRTPKVQIPATCFFYFKNNNIYCPRGN